ncbi:M1 family aminopeptidase [Pseudoalteromonas pernae]|uniref:M1 family aminopeptidase n=1 Tax=Pseudoalteromonas pernae TaxID=3118054 RepID=UPI003241E59B
MITPVAAKTSADGISTSLRFAKPTISYEIDAHLDVGNKYLDAKAVFTYKNNSPDTLTHLYFELPHQLYATQETEGQSLQAGSKKVRFISVNNSPLQFEQHGGIYAVKLNNALHTGQSITLHLIWDLQLIPRTHPARPRGGFEILNDGSTLLAVSEWYPRILGYDSRHQWDLLPFKGKGEFHSEFASFEVSLSVAENYFVFTNAPSLIGSEANPQSQTQTTVKKVLANTSSPSSAKVRTLRYKGLHQRDFTFAVVNNVVWERMSINTSNGITNINVIYPNNGRWLWQHHAMDATRHAIDYLDSTIAPFPFQEYTVINIAGIGMEYSGLTFVGFRGPSSENGVKPDYSRTQYYDVIAGIIHEVAHSYFPMLVNTNERREGFLDEGLTSYLAYLTEQAFSEDFQSFYGDAQALVPVFNSQFHPPVTLADDAASKLDSHYHIPATAWNILGRQIIGQERLLSLLNAFIRNNMYERVYFDDLTNFINAQTGDDLTPFFNDWFISGEHVDLAIESVNQHANIIDISIANLGGIETPVTLQLVFANGEIQSHLLSYKTWQQAQNQRIHITLNSPVKLTKAQLDPHRNSADVNRVNNVWFANAQALE